MTVWDRVAGQAGVARLLSAQANDPSDSYLFVGPRGVGKRGAALAFAAAILCPEGGCGRCGTCSRIERGLHPDAHLYHPEGFTHSVGVIREIVRLAAKTPLEAKGSVFIVAEADRIEEAAQNSLLKALEEPVASVTWILLAETLDRFLPTVLSRCRLVRFSGVDEETISQVLTDEGVSEVDQTWILRAARGDLEMALALATDERARSIRQAAIDVAVAPTTIQTALRWVDTLDDLASSAIEELERRQAAELDVFEDSVSSGRGTAGVRKRLTDRFRREARRVEVDVYLDFLVWLGNCYRDLAVLASSGSVSAITAPDASDALVEAPSAPPGVWLALADETAEARLAISENATAPLAVAGVVLEAVKRVGLAAYARS